MTKTNKSAASIGVNLGVLVLPWFLVPVSNPVREMWFRSMWPYSRPKPYHKPCRPCGRKILLPRQHSVCFVFLMAPAVRSATLFPSVYSCGQNAKTKF